jgi:hypothetical protein
MRPPYQWGIRRSSRCAHGHRYDLSTPEQSPQKMNWRGHGPPQSPRCHRRSRWPMEAKRTASRLLEAKGLKYNNARELLPIRPCLRGSKEDRIYVSIANKILQNFPSIIIAIKWLNSAILVTYSWKQRPISTSMQRDFYRSAWGRKG